MSRACGGRPTGLAGRAWTSGTSSQLPVQVRDAAEERAYAGCVRAFRRVELAVAVSLAVLIVVVPVMMRMVLYGGSALTGRGGRHSTAGLAVVAAARLLLAQLDEGVGHGHPQLGREGSVVGGPVGKEGSWAWFRPRFLAGLWHNAYVTTNAVLVPGAPERTHVARGSDCQ